MLFMSKRELCITCVSLMLVVSTVSGYTHTSSQRFGGTGGGSRRDQNGVKRVSGAGDSPQTAGGQPSSSSHSSSSSSSVRCQDGWLLSHNYCLLYTGLAPDQAELFCAEKGAEQAMGICVKKPMDAVEAVDDVDVDDVDPEESPSSSSSSSEMAGLKCPGGWTQYSDYCFLKPGPLPAICNLLGADYLFHHCVIRIPHLISTDFLKTVKRLDGDDQTMHRSTRICCCFGGGLCRK